jgi:hypothetical protein
MDLAPNRTIGPGRNVFHLPAGYVSAHFICDAVALAVLGLATVTSFLIFRDYGLGWDDYAHSEYGELLLSFYRSGFSDQRAFSFVNLYMYGGGFDVLAALASKISPFTLFETRRLLGAILGLIGLIVTWRIGRRIGGPFAGLSALLLLATCPLFVGHLFMNCKDGPFAVAMAILLLGTVRVFDEFPRPSPAGIALLGLGLGLSIGSRILGVFGLLAAAGGSGLLFAIDVQRQGSRQAAIRFGRFTALLLPGVLLGYVVMALVWPWGAIDPLNPLRALAYFSRFFEQPWHELFRGQLLEPTEMPRSYVPTLFALRLPELFLLLGFGGAAGAFVAASRRDVSPNRRAIFLSLALAGVAPLAAAVAMRPAMYNGIRHFVFVLPPLAVLGGVAASWVSAQVDRRAAAALLIVFLAGLLSPLIEMVRLHPYEYTHFNRIAGGVRGARGQYMLDYWGLSFKQASQELLARIAALGLPHPEGRRWKVAVCGPHRSPEVELGPDFEITWDPKGADFAMMLGEFYCRQFDAPVLATIVRDGVEYARLNDIRGRSYDTLLTIVPPWDQTRPRTPESH